MRKGLIVLLLVVLMVSIVWIFAGRQISEFVDQFKTTEIKSEPIRSISYEGTGDDGILRAGDVGLHLAPLNPHVGSTKDNQLALAYRGKVFAFGALESIGDVKLSANVDHGDSASISLRHSYIGWVNLKRPMTELNGNGYIELIWNKKDGPKLKMVWIWPEIHEDVRLIHVEISDAAR